MKVMKSLGLMGGLTILLSLIILFDFLIPGQAHNEEVQEIEQKRQQYYNAAQNSHCTYHIITQENRFIVSQEFAKQLAVGDEVTYSVSHIFREVNGYGKSDSDQMGQHSMRIFSGLVIPLLAIVVMIIGIRFKEKMGIVRFVIQVLLIADLIYLIQ